jgi:hypothetical protein
MPVPNLFKKSSSKKTVPKTDPAPDLQASDKGDVPRTVAMTSDSAAPRYSDGLREAYATVNRRLPEAHGAEKALNAIGTISRSHRVFFVQC